MNGNPARDVTIFNSANGPNGPPYANHNSQIQLRTSRKSFCVSCKSDFPNRILQISCEILLFANSTQNLTQIFGCKYCKSHIAYYIYLGHAMMMYIA